MGCSSGKAVAKPTAASSAAVVEQHTLLSSHAKDLIKQAVKEAAESWPDVGQHLERCAGFIEYEGFMDTGPDLLVQSLTLEEAKCKAATMDDCVGFTYEGEACAQRVKMYFKGEGNINSSKPGHTSYKKEEVVCAVGDSAMAIFEPNGRRYQAEIEFLNADNTITVRWKDGGKTHRVLPSYKVFKDAVGTPSAQVVEPRVVDQVLSQDHLHGIPNEESFLTTASPGIIIEVDDCAWPRTALQPMRLHNDATASRTAQDRSRNSVSKLLAPRQDIQDEDEDDADVFTRTAPVVNCYYNEEWFTERLNSLPCKTGSRKERNNFCC